MAPKPVQSLHASQRAEAKTQNTDEHLAQLCCPYLSRDITEITSLFGIKKNRAVWLGQRKPLATMSNKPGVICSILLHVTAGGYPGFY